MTFKQFLILLEDYVRYPNILKFHRDIYWPSSAVSDLARFFVRLPEMRQSAHWRKERSWKHDYEVSKPDLKPKYAFELQYSQAELVKVGFRVEHLDPKDDIIFIVAQDGTVVTTWPNAKSDTHRTLNRSNYASKWPENWKR